MRLDWSKDRNNTRKTYAKRYDIILFTITNHGHNVHLQCTLPGLKIKEPWYPSVDKAKVMAELMVDKWLESMQFQPTLDSTSLQDTSTEAPYLRG